VRRSADDLLVVLDSLNIQKSLLVGTSCAGQILTVFASQHPERVSALVYLDGASDPTLTSADLGLPMPDPATLPRLIQPPAPDHSSFEAYRVAQRRDHGVAFPEAELRQLFVANADGSVGASRFFGDSSGDHCGCHDEATLRRHPRAVLALYQADRPFEEVAARFIIRNEQERGALCQQYAATRALYRRWQQDLLAQIPTARIVELPGANLFMFLSNEADVVREIRAFAATFTGR
jgi:non-heme chloroperoxidase